MQSNDLKILAGQTVTMPCQGTGFWFESGASTTTDAYIIVKPDTGAEFTLKPGQHVQDAANPVGTWRIAAHDPAAVITGRVIIGNGEFGDSNTNNTFKLDGTFTNSVNVNNTTAQRVPVTLDTTQALKIDSTTPINVAGTTVQYTNAFADYGSTGIGAVQVFTAAANPNGAWIELAEFEICPASNNVQVVCSLLAKTGVAPTAPHDGDCLMLGVGGQPTGVSGGTELLHKRSSSRIKVPANKGVWIYQADNVARSARSVLYTLL